MSCLRQKEMVLGRSCFPHVLFKHVLKALAGRLAALGAAVSGPSKISRVVVLMFHRVARTACCDAHADSWNISPRRLERLIAWLSTHAECVRISEIVAKCGEPMGAKPRVALTFDDGFGNFATNALPVLERYQVPATVFLVTRFIGSSQPYPFDRWGHRNAHRTSRDCWLPLTWEQIEECAKADLVTFGSHSDTHPDPLTLSADDFRREAARSREVLRQRLGETHACAYAYPFGSTRLGQVPPAYVEAVRAAGFTLGFTTDLGAVVRGSRRWTLPRVEVHAWDNPAVMAAKARGILGPLRLTDWLRSAHRGEPLNTSSASQRPLEVGPHARG